ncbi:TetR/AcrR family transcriptional regulator [Microbacterium sp. ZW T5_45]|uniref:TetR/AcrR family transcriptional regulator n=1 Tax=Microbacterium sp. ZW T5_45 TaxID=3378080 RepID=UPI0038526F1B
MTRSDVSDSTSVQPRKRPRGPYAKSTETRQRIIEAAIAEFAENGYNSGSTQQIAVRAGLSSAQIFYYFPKKEDLLHAVLDHRDVVTDSIVAEGTGQPEDVPEVILRIAAVNDTIPGFISLYMILFAESTTPRHPGGDYFRDRYRRLRRQFAEAFAEMEEAGLLRPGVDARYAAMSTLAAWDGIQLQWMLEPEEISVVAFMRRHLASLVNVPVAGPA